MLVMMIIGWLVTVACFLLYVRRLRNIIAKDSEDSPIANSEHQPDDAWFASSYAGNQQSIEPVRLFEYKTSTVFPVSEQETCQPAVKIPKGWKKADGKTRHVKTGLIDIMWGDGAIDLNQLARVCRDSWKKSDSKCFDIIAYRVCKPKKPVKNQKVSSRSKKSTAQLKTVTVKKRVTK